MLSYGGSITSAFPNSFCIPPASLTCQLCGVSLTNENHHSTNNNNNNNINNIHSFLYQAANQQRLSSASLEKCIHCGINMCERCLNENQERQLLIENNNNNNNRHLHHLHHHHHLNQQQQQQQIHLPQSNSHYNLVKKEFKQMYNYSKEIVEKLHVLNNAIKIEESAVSDLNSIKHKVNTKAIELIKQINQEKIDLIEQIDNVKRKYESTLNERKEYYALSMQYKDELRKVIRKYKEHKSEEQCSLNDLLKLYFSVKKISKNLDDYDHIKLITEQDPLQVNFEERPTYRNLIGKLIINNEYQENTTGDIKVELFKANSDQSKTEVSEQLKNPSRNKFQEVKQSKKESASNSSNNKNSKTQSSSRGIKDMSRSYSLNDLIDTANHLMQQQQQQQQQKLNKKSNSKLNLNENLENISKSSFELDKMENRTFNKPQVHNKPLTSIQPQLPQQQQQQQQQPFFLQQKQTFSSSHTNFANIKKQPNQVQSILKKTEPQPNNVANKDLLNRIDIYKSKQTPKERLEIDILPSYLHYSQNKLLIASSFGKIRVVDLFSYKIQKDELKNLLINGICMARNISLPIGLLSPSLQTNAANFCTSSASSSPTMSSDQNEVLYAVSNGEMSQRDDVLNVSNSVIIVTKKELKVLKKDSASDNDNFFFLNPSGICWDEHGNLYICDSGLNRVKVLDGMLKLRLSIETASAVDDYLSKPKSLAYFQNVLFVCDSANHRIVSYSVLNRGEEIRFKCVYGMGYGNDVGMLRYPLDVCVDDLGVLSVRDHHNNRVQIFAPDSPSAPFHFIEVNSQRETIYSMAVAENGDIYVAKMVHIQDIDENGQFNTINKYFIDIY